MKTDTVIKQEGMNALISHLGYVDAERFIFFITKEPFDYTKWRDKYLNDDSSVRSLSHDAMLYASHL
ncbi:MAG: hypothetical protein LUF92_09055 [Clostridiales bacterium]|nr:hypothetical protein [Clostridiales bacterium]